MSYLMHLFNNSHTHTHTQAKRKGKVDHRFTGKATRYESDSLRTLAKAKLGEMIIPKRILHDSRTHTHNMIFSKLR